MTVKVESCRSKNQESVGMGLAENSQKRRTDERESQKLTQIITSFARKKKKIKVENANARA
jgi:hypothetical protein